MHSPWITTCLKGHDWANGAIRELDLGGTATDVIHPTPRKTPMIKPIGELQQRGMEINLIGPRGNAFNLFAVVCKMTGRDPTPLLAEMMAGDGDVIEVFERESGEFITRVRP